MTAPTASLREHHTLCDDCFAAAEAAAASSDWETAALRLKEFSDTLERHLHTEETVLFPAFEAATGMRGGPTQMMRHEHALMRDLCARMDAAVTAASADDFAGAAETLLILMQQHNMKEENILYPMCDRALDVADPSLGEAIVTGLQAAPAR